MKLDAMRCYLLGTVVASSLIFGVIVLGAGAVRPKPYAVSVALESATSVVKGGPVLVNGFKAGSVSGLEVKDGKAMVEFELDEDFAPLHDGAQVGVGWKATLSERQIEVVDGPKKNAAVPDGGMLRGVMPQAMEIDDVLGALDAPTRAKVRSLVGHVSSTLDGSETDINETIRTAGPAIQALGGVLQALGTDGPAIKNLVTRLDALMTTVGRRDGEVQQIVTQLDTLTTEVASRRTELRTSLKTLPGTLSQAQKTLEQVPATVDEVNPLLEDLAPATARLRPVAKNLRPLLVDLRPLIADLRPTLKAAQELLGETPALLDTTHAVLPGLTTAVKSLQKPAAFARPYTPELTGFFTNWASMLSNYDANGNFARIFVQESASSANVNPGVAPPGITSDPYPKPGAIMNQPWTDATGSEMR